MPQQAVVPSKRDWGDESDESDYSETGVSVRLLRRERTQIWRHDHSLRPINNKRDLNDTQQSPAARVVENNDRLGETAGDHEGPRHGHRRPSADTQDDINKGNELDELDPYPLNFYPPHDFQVIDLAAKTQIDKTIQFAVDISEDIEGHCEELSRLKRWGYFSMALEYFESNLQQHLDLPMVAIEYADLLSGQGSYRDLTKCRLDAPETMKTIPPSFEPSPNLYKTHFDLLILNAKIAFQSLAPEDLDSYDPVDFLFEISYEANLRLEEKTDSGRDIPFNYTEVMFPYHIIYWNMF
ncbi:hypothetical protein N7478_001737 [Penicillium angulare]|uniref:uncharacterized protein n=1 Tax=Penicillium angulare TaxID=116970 RepID=UPI002541B774|nr:uncharacterized protein N7478_001737 [Penicillium angulare]KAJ5288707.1 hypothetical protein N7478_001737 [Penicillium angulare]